MLRAASAFSDFIYLVNYMKFLFFIIIIIIFCLFFNILINFLKNITKTNKINYIQALTFSPFNQCCAARLGLYVRIYQIK